MVVPAIFGPPDWAALRYRAGIADRSPQLRSATEAALSTLERDLGPGWPGYAFEKFELPAEVRHFHTHLFAAAWLLDVAGRLEMLRPTAGMRTVRTSLTRSPKSDEWLHSRLLLEVGALGAAAGFDVVLEPAGLVPGIPADVRLTRGDLDIIVEARILLRDQQSIATSEANRAFHAELLRLRAVHHLAVGGHVDVPLSLDLVEKIITEVEGLAAGVTPDTGFVLQGTGLELFVSMDEDPVEESLRLVLPMKDQWERLRRRLVEKAQRTAQSGANWLRIDSFDLLWQLGGLRDQTLLERTIAVAERVRIWLAEFPHLDGIVVSDGGAMVDVMSDEQTVGGPSGAVGMRRRLDRIRVREMVLVPLHPGAGGVDAWKEMYDVEAEWLARQLAESGLGFPPELELSDDQKTGRSAS